MELQLPFLLCLLCASASVLASQLPTTVQFDLVFPRNNTTYQPVYPFPIVFALHNGSAAWPYVLHWDWEITTTGSEFDMIASGGFTAGIPGEGRGPAPPDSHLVIEPRLRIDQHNNSTVPHALRFRDQVYMQ
jgi:hypothetical protein